MLKSEEQIKTTIYLQHMQQTWLLNPHMLQMEHPSGIYPY